MKCPRFLTALTVAGFLLGACGDDDAGSGDADQAPATTAVLLDTSSAVAELEAIFEAIFERVELSDSVTGLDECPLGRMQRSLGELWGASDELVTEPGLRGTRSASVYSFAPDFSPMVSCDRYADDEEPAGGIGVYAMLAPSSVRGFVEAFAVVDGGEPPEVQVDEAVEYHGGRFYRVCVRYSVDAVSNYCEIVWVNGDVLLGTYVAGPNATDADLAATQEVFAAELSRFVETFGAP